MNMDFTAIDFETANGKRASVCAVGMTKVRNGKIIDQASWLIKPPPGFTTFADRNIAIHKITEADVVNAPSWTESAARIRDFVGNDIVVAHYATFDKSVWRQACEWSGVDFGDFHWLCSRDLARAHLGLQDCSLPTVADSLGIKGLDHHNAASDASVCAQIVLAIAQRAGVSTWVDLDTVTPQKSAISRSGRPYSSEPSIRKSDLPEPNLNADPEHELFGQGLTITGGFELLGRREAFQLAASFGASVQLSTTRKTTILVICDENPHAPGFDLRHGTTKARKAHEYITERAQQIRIMSETEFYVAVGMVPASMLEANRTKPQRTSPLLSQFIAPSLESAEINSVEAVRAEASSTTHVAEPTIPNDPLPASQNADLPSLPSHPFDNAHLPVATHSRVSSSRPPRTPNSRRQTIRRITFMVTAWILAIATGFSLLCTAVGYSFDAVAGTTFLTFSVLLGTGCFFAFRTARKR